MVEVEKKIQYHSGIPIVYGPGSVHSQHTEYQVSVYCNYCEELFRAVRGMPDKVSECIEREKEMVAKQPKTLLNATQGWIDDLKTFERTLFPDYTPDNDTSGR